MGCRKKAWLCLSLWNVFVYIAYANGVNLQSLSHRRCENENNLSPSARISYINAESQHRRRRERNLMVVLPVMTGNNNYSTDKLQFWYTKAPVTVVIKDPEDTTKMQQPQSFSTRHKEKVPPQLTNTRLPPTELNFDLDFLGYRYRTTNAPLVVKTSVEKSTSASSSLEMFEFVKKMSLEPVSVPETDNMDVIRSDGDHFALLKEKSYVSKTENSLDATTNEYAPFDSEWKTQSWERTSSLVPDVGNDTRENANWNLNEVNSTFYEDEKLLTKLAENVHAPSSQLTNQMRLILYELGILKRDNETIASNSDGHSNKLESDSSTFIVDAVPYAKFKKIPTQFNRTPVRDDMQTLLDSFGLLSKRNPNVDNSVVRTARQVRIAKLNDARIKQPNTNIGRKQSSTTTSGVEKRRSYSQSRAQKRNIHDLFEQTKLTDQSPSIDFAQGFAETPVKIDLNEAIKQPVARISLLIPVNRDEITFSLPLNQTIPLSPKELANIPIINLNDLVKQRPGFVFSEPLSISATEKATEPTTTKITRIKENMTEEITAIGSTADDNGENNISVSDLTNLLASFGGKETGDDLASAAVNDEPTAKPNGLYFLVDWNKFYNVGDQVHKRFSPKVGNPRNFVPITVP